MAGLDTESTDTPYPIWGFGPPSPEPDTKNLDALLDSLNGSAERFQTLWFSFLGLTLYLAIAALATTHRNLLLGEPQVLPILNIKVDLLPFYVIAPLLYLVFHFYLLMMLTLLARTAGEFDKQLRTTLPDEPERERYRAQVGNALFLQILIGMKQERAGFNGTLLSLIARITIVWAPLATLILIQLQFLPYHGFGITWWHRALVLADVVLIIVMWRSYSVQSSIEWPFLQYVRNQRLRDGLVWVGNLSLLVVAFFWLSFWEGRWAGEPWIGRPNFASTANGVVFGLFPDRLKLNNETIVGKEKLEKTKEEIASRGGNFVPTIKLDFRDVQAAVLNGADLRGVSLNGAAMRGANLSFARLDGANLFSANLRGAGLENTQLQGAGLENTQLQGAHLDFAQVQGAGLNLAQLQGANLSHAQLQAADLEYAQLQDANLNDAKLQGADLSGAQLQGANLSGAQLQGADFFGAALQGADLSGANMADGVFDNTLVFRANIDGANLSMASLRSVRANQVRVGEEGKGESLSAADVDDWIAAATRYATEENHKEIRKGFERLVVNPAFQTPAQDAKDEARWRELTKQSLATDIDGAHHRERLAAFLGDLACNADRAPYIARALIGRPVGRLAKLGDQLEGVRKRMKEGRDKPDACKGVVGFTEEDWHNLDAIKPIEPAPTNP